MGVSPSKRVSQTFLTSTEFTSSCDSVFADFQTLTHHRFPGIFPYQLSDATSRLHNQLRSLSFSLINRWVPSPPSQTHVDRVYRASVRPPAKETISRDEFRVLAVAVFSDAVVSAAVKEAAVMFPIFAGGIVGVGMVSRARRDVIGGVIVAYALSAATSMYISLGK